MHGKHLLTTLIRMAFMLSVDDLFDDVFMCRGSAKGCAIFAARLTYCALQERGFLPDRRSVRNHIPARAQY